MTREDIGGRIVKFLALVVLCCQLASCQQAETGAARRPGTVSTAGISGSVQVPTANNAPPANTGLLGAGAVAGSGQTPAVTPLSAEAKTEDERNTIDVFEAAAPATVFVTNNRVVVDQFRGYAREVEQGSGSGFIWDERGHVVTNFHVISGRARKFSVTLHDHRSFEARLIGAEPAKDIAVLRMIKPPADLRPMRVTRGLRLSVGQKAIAIGNPFGFDQTLTTGVVSALGRSMPGPKGVTIRDMVQTDAAINPGNSGGPLIDSQGRLIGMNTMIASPSGAAAGVGFAVPLSAIARVVPQIIKTGKAEQIGIGIFVDFEQRLERRNRIDGFIIQRVEPGGPADRAGLKGVQVTPRRWLLGDVLVGIGDEKIENYDDLYNAFDRHRAGEKVKVTVMRNERPLTVEVELVAL